MPEARFLPYRWASDALELHIFSVSLDEQAIPIDECVDGDSHQIVLFDREEWTEASIGLAATDPNAELPEVLPDGEDAARALKVLAIVRSGGGRRREVFELNPAAADRWEGQVTLHLADHVGRAVLEVFAVRGVPQEAAAGLATRAGERVASVPVWSVYVDDRPLMPGGAIDGEWRHFGNDERADLRERKDCAWFLDLADAERPRLFLNEGVECLRRGLEAPAIRGRPARVRDTLAHSVLQPALLSLASFALSSASTRRFEDLEGWRKSVLEALARLSNSSTTEATVEGWLCSWEDRDVPQVVRDLTTAIQRHLKFSDSASKLVTAMENPKNA